VEELEDSVEASAVDAPTEINEGAIVVEEAAVEEAESDSDLSDHVDSDDEVALREGNVPERIDTSLGELLGGISPE
jgi:hypothetical protein